MSLIRIAACACLLALALTTTLLETPAEAQRRVAPSLDVEEVMRGKDTAATVSMSVSTKPISLRRLSVRVRGTEMVNLPYVVPEEKDAKGKQIYPSRNVTVKKEEVIFEKEYTIITGQELPAGSHHKFTGNIEIPAHLPPSVKGKYAQIRWEARAETDLPGGFFFGADPNSPWVELAVK